MFIYIYIYICVHICIYIYICFSSEEQTPHKYKQMHCRTRRGKTNMPVPILEQIMACSVCIAHFRSWPFKSNCAKSPLDKA